MTSSAEPTVVLVGPMAAGKTSIGRSVARMLGERFRDSDKRIAALYGPIPEIFAEHGEAHFRMREREVIADLLGQEGVLSLGGGAVTDPETRQRLRAHRVAFLTVTPEAVAGRIRGGGRPLLAGDEDPVDHWTRIFDERRSLYEEVADATFDTSRIPLQQVAAQITDWLKESTR